MILIARLERYCSDPNLQDQLSERLNVDCENEKLLALILEQAKYQTIELYKKQKNGTTTKQTASTPTTTKLSVSLLVVSILSVR